MTPAPAPSNGLPLAQQALLLDLVSTARPVTPARLDGLTEADWDALLRTARQHRLGPLLHWQLGPARAHAGLPLPPAVRAGLAEQHREAAWHSLLMQRELGRAHGVLAQAGIAHMALKGACLAWQVYPEPALRPLRDLDLLVPRPQALAAFEALLDAGWLRCGPHQGTPQAALALHHKHLPPLRSPHGRVIVELHGGLFHPVRNGQAVDDLAEDPAFWARAPQAPLAGGGSIAVESPTDLLLHLIVHAAHDHAFNNGPLLLSDVAFLLRRRDIDWSLFWVLATRCRAVRACRLALDLVRRHWGPQPVTWPDDGAATATSATADAEWLDTASALMLRGHTDNPDEHLHGDLTRHASPAAMAQLVWRKMLFPPRAKVATLYPVLPRSPAVWLWYPVNWWRLLGQRLPRYWRNRRQARFQADARRRVLLQQWLGQG